MISVIEYIKSHDGLPITATNLSQTFGIPAIEVRRIVNAARSEGCPICSCNKGYYYSEDSNDVLKTVNSLKHRVESIQRAISGLSNYLGG